MPAKDDSVIVLRGRLPGKCLLVLSGVHGNEYCGIEAFKRVLPQLQVTSGTIIFAIANPDAVENNKRYVEANLNRLFRNDDDLSSAEKSSLEYKRSREIIPLLEQADALLDIHSSATPGSPTFAICEPHVFDIAQKLPVSLISTGWDALEPGGTDYFMNARGKIGICVECGQHDDPASVECAIRSIFAFLLAFNAIDGTLGEPRDAVKKKVVHMTHIHKTKKDFLPARTFADFEPVPKGEFLGTDGDEQVLAPQDGVVAFVRKRVNPQEEAFIFGKIEKLHHKPNWLPT